MMSLQKNVAKVSGLLIFCMVFAASAYAGEKYGFVELRSLFDNYERTEEADKVMADAAKAKQEERDKLVEGIRSIKDEMSLYAEGSEDRIQKEEQINGKIQELQKFDEQAQAELSQLRNENVKDIFDDINAVIQEYGKKKGYDMIFGDRALVYKDEKYNLTADIAKELEKQSK